MYSVRELQEHRAWEKYFKDEPKTWERFCREELDTEPEFVEQVEIGVRALEAAGHFGAIPDRQALDAATLLTKKEAMKGNCNANKSFTSQISYAHVITDLTDKVNESNRAKSIKAKGSNDVKYLTARIARDRPDIHERMKAGEYKSVRSAAKAAGIVREPTNLEKAQKAWLKLTAEERSAFQKWMKEQ